MPEVTLAQVLKDREDRVRLQREMLDAYRCPLVCFTMNIAGPVKISPLIERTFHEGLEALLGEIPEHTICEKRVQIAPTGCQALLSVSMEAGALKRICTGIEDKNALGRLFDMDVLDTDGRKLERSQQRGCIVCGAPGRGCAAGRLHSVGQLQAATRQIIEAHFAERDRKLISSLAVQSLLDEVNTTPKPGLVDLRNNGSHRDMQPSTFAASAASLRPYFEECFQLGQISAAKSPADTFVLLRPAGMAAEETMYRVTGGVNTHKGAIFTMGVLCASAGRLWLPESPVADAAAILAQCGSMTAQAMKEDFARADGSTAGQRLYIERGLTGIRGEVSAGLPSVAKISLPVYTDLRRQGLSANDAGSVALLHLIANAEDTVLYHRGGASGAAFAATEARRLLNQSPIPTKRQIESLDDEFILRNLSPGGCADLLAATYFLYALEERRRSYQESTVFK